MILGRIENPKLKARFYRKVANRHIDLAGGVPAYCMQIKIECTVPQRRFSQLNITPLKGRLHLILRAPRKNLVSTYHLQKSLIG